ncbi:hypothetical protein ES707_04936 [subsurface metagenome]
MKLNLSPKAAQFLLRRRKAYIEERCQLCECDLPPGLPALITMDDDGRCTGLLCTECIYFLQYAVNEISFSNLHKINELLDTIERSPDYITPTNAQLKRLHKLLCKTVHDNFPGASTPAKPLLPTLS